MNKLTQKQIEEIKELVKQGKTKIELAELFKVTKQTIMYWTNEEYKKKKSQIGIEYYKNLPLERKKELYQKKKEYIKKYMKKRYNEDFEFRKRQIEHSKKWKLKNKTEKHEVKLQ